MANDSVGCVLVFIEEVSDTRESYLVDIFVNFTRRHSDTSVADGERSLFCVETNADCEVTQIIGEIAFFFQRFHLLCSINGVAYHLAEKNFMVGIEKLFYDGEDVLCSNPDVTFLHNLIV